MPCSGVAGGGSVAAAAGDDADGAADFLAGATHFPTALFPAFEGGARAAGAFFAAATQFPEEGPIVLPAAAAVLAAGAFCAAEEGAFFAAVEGAFFAAVEGVVFTGCFLASAIVSLHMKVSTRAVITWLFLIHVKFVAAYVVPGHERSPADFGAAERQKSGLVSFIHLLKKEVEVSIHGTMDHGWASASQSPENS